MTKELSDRAKLRLRLAAGLLRGMGKKLDMPRTEFYSSLQKILADLESTERDKLKGLTDWLEDYSNNEPDEPKKRTETNNVGSSTSKYGQ